MKREWTPTELVATFRLTNEEHRWIRGTAAHNRLGLAVMLKVFQYQGRFPDHPHEVPPDVQTYIAQQLAVTTDALDPETWTGRTAQRQRLGFHPASVTDIQALVLWLTQQPLMGHDHDLAALKALAYQRLYQLRIEPPTPDRLDRAVRSAIHRFEHNLFRSIYRAMPASTLLALDRLVRTEATDEDDDRTFHHSRFLKLKRDPMQMSLRAVMEEVEKLAWLQAVELPPDLLAHLTPKLIRKYRQRAAAEPPRELRSHPNPIKYTLLAAFCWQRRREVTDNLVDLLIRVIRKMQIRAEQRVEAAYLADIRRVQGKQTLLFRLAQAALEN